MHLIVIRIHLGSWQLSHTACQPDTSADHEVYPLSVSGMLTAFVTSGILASKKRPSSEMRQTMKEMSKSGMEKIAECLWKVFPPTLKKNPRSFTHPFSCSCGAKAYFAKLAENEWYLTKNTSNVGQLHRKGLAGKIKTRAQALVGFDACQGRLHWSLREINCFSRKLEATVQDVPHLSI